jgi:TolA-binding protein
MALVFVPAAGAQRTSGSFQQGQAALEKGDTNKALSEIFNILQKQQQQMDLLMQRSQKQETIIEQQKQLLEQQAQQMEQQKQEIEQQKEQLTAAPRMPEGFADNYSADKQYDVAYQLQHVAIFDVRRKDAPPYFKRAAKEFAKLVEKFPNADKADDAQYRIGKIYHRYLKDYSRAIQEYQRLLELYPESEYVDDAREALSDLQ